MKQFSFMSSREMSFSIFGMSTLFLSFSYVQADFFYPDFDQTLGLVFNGDATISDCDLKKNFISSQNMKLDLQDRANYDLEAISELHQVGSMQTRQTVSTDIGDDESSSIRIREAQFGHRDNFTSSSTSGCSSRLRLTPSGPSKVGSVWYEKRLPVLKGFDTIFTFQVSDHSRVCSYHVEPTFSLTHHRSCAVHGGDGFAFVIHADDKHGTGAIGGDGQDLGYGGILNSIAVEFDMWTNVDTQGSNDIFHDHVSIHSASVHPNSPEASTALGYSRAADLADGNVHTVRIQYLSYLETKYFDQMTANDNLLPYLKDNGEGRRLGTLAVFINEGIEGDKPLLAIPLNLSVLLDLPQSLAYAGFTAATGRNWEKHDIISWHWCETGSCVKDYEAKSRFSETESFANQTNTSNLNS